MNSREQFVKAMLVLLNKYPIEKISVEMIIRQSDSSKSSFYRLFLDKYQLMTLSYADYIDKIIDKDFERTDWVLAQEIILQFMYENKKAFVNIFKIEGQDSFSKFLYAYKLGYMKEAYMKRKGNTELSFFEAYLLELYAAAVVHSEKQWVKRGMDITPKELTDIIIAGMPDMIKSVLLSSTI